MRALARWGAMPLLAAPIGAWALGLGDIELRSALNQPFQAEILLVSATADDLRDLKVVLATREAYESRGLDRADFLSSPRISDRQRPSRTRRRPDHVSGVDHRAVRDDARRDDLAARPVAARVHGPARSAGIAARSRRTSGRAARADASRGFARERSDRSPRSATAARASAAASAGACHRAGAPRRRCRAHPPQAPVARTVLSNAPRRFGRLPSVSVRKA